MLVTKVVMPQDKYSIKCPYSMKPEGISIHNTANDASAMAEISYMIRNNNKVSFHEAVDDYRVVQGIEHNRNAWHAGDGHGFGNMKTIGIEICYSKSGGERFEKAERNAAERIAYLMKQYGWTLDNITDERHTIGTHQNRSGKYCPHRTLDNGLERFYNMIREEYKELTGETAIGTPNIVVDESKNNTGRSVGEVVTINGVYTSSSSTRKLNSAVKSGMITRIIPGAKNPYLLNNGNIGWVNDSCIVSSANTKVENNNTSAAPTIAVGSTVVLSANATNYATGQKIPSCYKNRKYTIMQVGNGKVLLKELYSWVYTKDLVGYTNNTNNTNTTSSTSTSFSKWQKVMNKTYNCGLAEENSFGSDSRAKAIKYYLCLKFPTIKNDHVKFIQERLCAHGFKTAIDGSFGPHCETQVKAFQKANGLTVDGFVGAETTKLLLKD